MSIQNGQSRSMADYCDDGSHILLGERAFFNVTLAGYCSDLVGLGTAGRHVAGPPFSFPAARTTGYNPGQARP
jgi:hypothetical protein